MSIFDDFDFLKQIKVICVSPPLIPSSRDNPYLINLYKLRKKKQIQVISIFPKTFLKPLWIMFSGTKVVWHHHWVNVNEINSLPGETLRLLGAIIFWFFGGKLIWTPHNLKPHHSNLVLVAKLFYQIYGKIAFVVLAHRKDEVNKFSKLLRISSDKINVLPHPKYEETLLNKSSSEKWIYTKFGWDFRHSKVFLVFGIIAPYKGIDEIITIFKRIPKENVLLIVGEYKSKQYFEYIKALQLEEPNIYIHPQRVPGFILKKFFGITDAVLFNFKYISTSGSVRFAADMNKQIFIPRNFSTLSEGYSKAILFSGIDDLKNQILAFPKI